MTWKTLLTLAALSAATTAQAATPTVRAAGAWCRAAPVGALAGGCYVTLTASDDDRLVDVRVPSADHGEIHTMDMTGGVMRMRRLNEGIVLPKGQPVELKPGARHLMVIGPKQTLAAGGSLTLTLRFEKAAPLTLQAPIRAVPAPGAR